MIPKMAPDGEHAAARRAEQVDRRVLEPAVHALHDRAVEVQHVHVEPEVDQPEVEERAGDDPPPLAIGHEEAVDQVLLAQRPDAAGQEPAAEGLAAAERRVDAEQGGADGDDRVRDQRDVGGVGAARPVELAARLEVVPGLLEQPGDAVRDRAALVRRGAPIGLAVGGDGRLQLSVADELLRDAAIAEPGIAAPGVRRRLPGGERSRLVVLPVARRADRLPGVAGEVRVGVAGQRGQDANGPGQVAGLEEPAPLLEAQRRFIGHACGIMRTRERPPRVGTSAVVVPAPWQGASGVGPDASNGCRAHLLRRRNSITSS
jgi:hypothetical protein